jgi:GNAT superfamily N-acetyltransferase
MSADSVDVRTYSGAELHRHLDAVAALRIAVFRDWPYLYEGDVDYEREYLEAYAASSGSILLLATEGDRVIGASTGLPLADDTAEFRAPFDASGIDIESVFYFGESVLLPEYRGRGIGHVFFDRRESHARERGRFSMTAFCAVDRDANDRRRPLEYRGNEAFWGKRGYVRRADMTMRLMWNEIGRGNIEHALTFWTRSLDQGGDA